MRATALGYSTIALYVYGCKDLKVMNISLGARLIEYPLNLRCYIS